MDKSYIIRIYKQDNETVDGILEDVELNKRGKFSNVNQLWSLITRDTDQSDSNVYQSNIYNIMQKR